MTHFTNDQLEFFKFSLNTLFVIATAGVWLGVFLESERFSKFTQLIGWKLLVACLGAETLFGVFLWQSDSEISRRQKDEIVALEMQIAPRRISPDGCRDIANLLASSSGTVKVISYAADIEGGVLAWQVADCLEASKKLKIIRALASVMPLGGFGLGIFVSGPDKKLIAAIRSGLSEKGKLFVAEGNGFFAGNQSIGPANEPAVDAIVLVAIRPLPEMLPK